MKKNKIICRLAAVIGSVLLVIGMTGLVYADPGQVDTSRRGSISLTLIDSGSKEPVPGGILALYQVAEVTLDANGNQAYTLTNGFEDCGVVLGDLSSSTLGAQLKASLGDTQTPDATQELSKEGRVTFSNLPVGVYLITQPKALENYDSIAAFVVSVPLLEDGSWSYDVNATPKVITLTDGNTEVNPTPTPTPGPDDESEEEDEEEEEEEEEGGGSNPTSPPSSHGGGSSTLPQTGQLDWPVPVLATGGLLLFAFGWSLRREKH